MIEYPEWIKKNITIADMKRFWENIGIEDKCELCHTDDWFFNETLGEQNITLPLFGKNFDPPGIPRQDSQFLVTLFAVCKNCGNFRFFAKTRVVQVLKGLEKENG